MNRNPWIQFIIDIQPGLTWKARGITAHVIENRPGGKAVDTSEIIEGLPAPTPGGALINLLQADLDNMIAALPETTA